MRLVREAAERACPCRGSKMIWACLTRGFDVSWQASDGKLTIWWSASTGLQKEGEKKKTPPQPILAPVVWPSGDKRFNMTRLNTWSTAAKWSRRSWGQGGQTYNVGQLSGLVWLLTCSTALIFVCLVCVRMGTENTEVRVIVRIIHIRCS